MPKLAKGVGTGRTLLHGDQNIGGKTASSPGELNIKASTRGPQFSTPGPGNGAASAPLGKPLKLSDPKERFS